MNVRIQLLAEQAGWCVDDDEFSTYFGRFAEKFAELLVRECAEVAVDLGCGDLVDIRQKLFDHFALPHTDVQTSWPDNPLEG